MAYDRLSEMFRLQYEQQILINGTLPEGRDEQRAIGQSMATLLGGQVYDYLNATGYKSWLSAAEAPRSARVLQIVDVVKYALALAWTEGVTAAEFHEAFVSKTKTVTERHTHSIATSKIAGFDIDGVLAEYGDWGPTESEFIECGGVLTLRPLQDAAATLRRFKDTGWTIVIVTARKAHVHKRLERDTHDWLQMHDIPYDRVLFGYDKMESIKAFGGAFSFHVDDSLKHTLDVADGGVPVMFMMNGGPPIQHKNVYNVSSLADVWNLMGDC